MHKNDTEKLEAVAHQLPGWVNVVIPGDKILRGMVRSYLAPFQFIVYEITESVVSSLDKGPRGRWTPAARGEIKGPVSNQIGLGLRRADRQQQRQNNQSWSGQETGIAKTERGHNFPPIPSRPNL